MARKRLIKGANAARVEERIARVPADVNLPESAAESSIFDALRALEGTARSAPQSLPRAVRTASAPAKAPASARPSPSPVAAPTKRHTPASTGSRASPSAKPKGQSSKATIEPEAPAKAGRLSPSDFSAVEREAIVRCCSDYKNRLPTYLLAVQKEVGILDSVIEKCHAVKRSR